jgi:predicted nucleotidyltransferase
MPRRCWTSYHEPARHRRCHEKRDELLEQVKQTVHEIEPDADIILYGSRARGDAHAESDWDFLILLDGVVDDARTDAIRHRLYEIEWDCGEVLSSIVRSRQEWDTPLHQVTPLSKVIREQGILI